MGVGHTTNETEITKLLFRINHINVNKILFSTVANLYHWLTKIVTVSSSCLLCELLGSRDDEKLMFGSPAAMVDASVRSKSPFPSNRIDGPG